MAYISSEVADRALALLLDDLKDPEPEEIAESPIDQVLKETSKLELLIDTFRDHVRRRITGIRQRHNHSVPISRLPPEILSMIFVKVAEESQARSHHATSVRLAMVSLGWYSICTSTPKLWNRISEDMSGSLIHLQLERSKQAPLHVTCGGCWESEVTEWFLDKIMPHISRWKAISLESPCDQEVVSNLQNKHFPLLESFSASLTRNDTENISPVSLNISAPSLRDLKALGFPFPLRLESGLYLHLRELCFSHHFNGLSLPPEHYRLLFLSAPYLEDIKLYGSSKLHDELPATHENFDVMLRNLKSIQISWLPWTITTILLSSISTAGDEPPQLHVTVSPPISLFLPTSPRISGSHSLLATIHSSDWFSATLDGSETSNFLDIAIGTGYDTKKKKLLRLELDCAEEGLVNGISHFIGLGCFSRVKVAKVEGLRVFGDGTLPWNNSSFPSLEDIRIGSRISYFNFKEENTDPLNRIIDRLSSPEPSQVSPWPCRRLQRLSLACSVDEGSLMRLFKARGRDATSRAVSPDPPCRLELVEIITRNEEWHPEPKTRIKHHAAKHDIEVRYRHLPRYRDLSD